MAHLMLFFSLNPISLKAGKVITMAGEVDKAKGRVKEAAGAMTGNERLKNSGKADQAAGAVKRGAEKVVNVVKDAVKGKKP